MKRRISFSITAGFGRGFRISNSTARFAGSSSPIAITAMTPTTTNDATTHPWRSYPVSRKPLYRASWNPAANVIVTSVGTISTIFGISRFASSIRAGTERRPMIGPSTRPKKRSIPVHTPPPAT